MINNDSLMIKTNGHIKRILAKDLPTEDIFAVWNGVRWMPVVLGKIKKLAIKEITLENGLTFTATEEDNYNIGDEIYINKCDAGQDTRFSSQVPTLGLCIGAFLNNGKFSNGHTIYNIPDDKTRNLIKDFWEMCGSETSTEGNELIVKAKTSQNIIQRYIDLTNEEITLTNGAFDTSGKFKLGFIKGIIEPNNSDDWGRILRTNTILDDYIISIIANLGLNIEVNAADIYYRGNNLVKDTHPLYHTSKIKSISELSKTKKNIYTLMASSDNFYYMLDNGILIKQ